MTSLESLWDMSSEFEPALSDERAGYDDETEDYEEETEDDMQA